MEFLSSVLAFFSSMNLTEWVAAITALLGGLIAVFSLIKGPQPEKFLKSVLGFLEKFSRK